MKRVLLGLGSNKNFDGKSSLELLSLACHDLSTFLFDCICSSVYKTKAMYYEDQNDFYNMVLMGFISDDADAFFLLDEIHKIEQKYGRDRSKEIRFGPRSLDIDIELFGDEVIDTPDLQIPHIRIKERAFVLIPALEIFEKSADVKSRERYKKYLAELNQKDIDEVKLFVTADDFLSSGGF